MIVSTMEMTELRYFAAAAEAENVNKAARLLAISPGSVSKAIARLEDELGLQLFERSSRGVRLTAPGRILQMRAAELLRLEASTRAELRGEDAELAVRIAGPEVLLARRAPDLAKRIQQRHPRATFELIAAPEAEVVRLVERGSVHLGLTTGAVPRGLAAKTLLHTVFQTCVGRGHPLHRAAKAGTSVPVAEVLLHPFVAPDRAVLGTTDAAQSPDGWRDDKFPRRIAFVTASLSTIEELVTSGAALAYLPDYYAEQIPVAVLSVVGCPYSCKQTVRLIAKAPESTGWINQLF